MTEVYWHAWKSWPQRWRRVYIATWPLSAVFLTTVVMLFCFAALALLIVAWAINPFFWLYEKLSDVAWELKYQWRKE